MESTSLTKGAAGFPARARTYIDELKLEMRRVTWPSWDQVRSTTGVVIAAVFLFAAYFAVVDFLVSRGVTSLFAKLTH
jgi:preprotein translocase subunit SecE